MDALWSAVWGRLGALLIWGMPQAVHSLQLPGLCSPWQAVHSLPAGAGIWPPAFPPRSPRGPLQHKTGCWRTLFLYPPPPLCKQSLQRSLGDTKKPDDLHHPVFVAEREGFEPPDPLRSTVFKTAAIDHSATSPSALGLQM